MTSGSKLRFFSIFVLLIILADSCNKEKYDVVPDVQVDFTIDLYDVEFSILNGIGNYVYINAGTNNWGQRAAGYDGNGIIVCYTGFDGYEYSAYDRTCPYDYAVNGLSVKVSVVDMQYAECSECKTRYALPANGTPSSGIGQYPLKNYSTSFDGRYIHVWNNK
jgi:hypothetical protein